MVRIPLTDIRLHVVTRRAKILWKKRTVRMATVLVIVVVVAAAQYYFANMHLPVDLETTKIPPIRLGQEFVLYKPIIGVPPAYIFSHEGDVNEIVEVILTNASVTDETIAGYGFKSSASIPGPISYRSLPPDAGRSLAKPCTAAFQLNIASGQTVPNEIHFSQTIGPGNENYRDLEAKADAELVLTLETKPPDPPVDNEVPSYDDGPGCLKRITGPTWEKEEEGAQLLKFNISPKSMVSFRFLPLRKEAAIWNGADGFLEPFRVSSPVYSAQRVVISTPEGEIPLDITSVKDTEPLRVDKFKLGSDRLVVELSGLGSVMMNEKPITLNTLKRIEEYPLMATLFGIANLALLTWLIRQIKELFR